MLYSITVLMFCSGFVWLGWWLLEVYFSGGREEKLRV